MHCTVFAQRERELLLGLAAKSCNRALRCNTTEKYSTLTYGDTRFCRRCDGDVFDRQPQLLGGEVERMLPAARLFTADETLRIEKVRYRADVALAFARGKPLQVLLLVKVSVPLRGRLDILDQLPDHRLILQPLAALPDEGHRFAFERRRVL